MRYLVIYHGRSQNGQAKPACSLLGYLPADWTTTTQFLSGGWLAQSKQHINTQDWEIWVKREALWQTHSIKGRSKEFQFYEMFQLHVFVSRFSARSLGFQLGVRSSVAETVIFFQKLPTFSFFLGWCGFSSSSCGASLSASNTDSRGVHMIQACEPFFLVGCWCGWRLVSCNWTYKLHSIHTACSLSICLHSTWFLVISFHKLSWGSAMPVLCLLPCSCRWRIGIPQDLGLSPTRLTARASLGAGSAAAWETCKATGYHSTRTVNRCKQCTNGNENISSQWRQRVWKRNSKIKMEWNKNGDLQLKLAKYTLTQDFFNAFVFQERVLWYPFRSWIPRSTKKLWKNFRLQKSRRCFFLVFFFSCFLPFFQFFTFDLSVLCSKWNLKVVLRPRTVSGTLELRGANEYRRRLVRWSRGIWCDMAKVSGTRTGCKDMPGIHGNRSIEL